ncbi:hypothetical protein Sinac_0657 [Singulisphaera acidiphila DSM 18658]|uniref:Uncharacterized protein n=1 Tax=Singulisphaera acidiphila (strain ATCC BAA-1392 / DSM 18658 / VKM B-2454 / MOB10) TaxID=886293 RepID=L0D753_SINAD|nr:hypothetical protein Sinac_0657 [Singulisphaera acidiphila DSM 18658]
MEREEAGWLSARLALLIFLTNKHDEAGGLLRIIRSLKS